MFGAKACPFFGLVFGVNFWAMFKGTSWVEQLAVVSACVDKWQGPEISDGCGSKVLFVFLVCESVPWEF